MYLHCTRSIYAILVSSRIKVFIMADCLMFEGVNQCNTIISTN